jgi:hypothetical protein
MRRWMIGALCLGSAMGCAEPPAETQCATSRDCPGGSWCYLGECSGAPDDANVEPAAKIKITVVDAPAPGVEYGVGEVEEIYGLASGCAPPRPGELVLHEVLARVPDGEAGDASGDGLRDAYGDEFVELVHVGAHAIELGGVTLLNGERVKHTFEAMCLEPGAAIVVFGGAPGPGPWDEGVFVVRSQSRLGLSNEAGAVGLRGADGGLLARFVYSDAQAQSYVLWPEITGAALVPHEQAAPGVLFSPGTCADGSPLADGCPAMAP